MVLLYTSLHGDGTRINAHVNSALARLNHGARTTLEEWYWVPFDLIWVRGGKPQGPSPRAQRLIKSRSAQAFPLLNMTNPQSQLAPLALGGTHGLCKSKQNDRWDNCYV